MKKIKKGQEDIVDVLTGEVSYIKSVKYYTHLAPNSKIVPQMTINDKAVICRLSSTQLGGLQTGELMCEIELESADSAFSDGQYNIIQSDQLGIWLS